MHAADLGVFQDALGSIMWLEISHKEFYRTNELGMAALNNQLRLFYQAHPHLTSACPLTLAQIKSKDPGYPLLKCKAAQTRHLAGFGLLLANRHLHGSHELPRYAFRAGTRLAEKTDEHLTLQVSLFEGMTEYCWACDSRPFDGTACRAGMYKFLKSLIALNSLWRLGLSDQEKKQQPFHMRPKAHLLQHLVEDQLPIYGNPAECWCYLDESFVGHVKGVAAASKCPKTLEQRVGEKIILLGGIEAAEEAAHRRRGQGVL